MYINPTSKRYIVFSTFMRRLTKNHRKVILVHLHDQKLIINLHFSRDGKKIKLVGKIRVMTWWITLQRGHQQPFGCHVYFIHAMIGSFYSLQDPRALVLLHIFDKRTNKIS